MILLAAVSPDRDGAAAWARAELSDPGYARARPGLVVRALQWLLHRLADVGGALPWGPGRFLGALLLVAGLAVVAVVVARRTGLVRRDRRDRGSAGVFDRVTATAAEHRRRAEAAERVGDHAVAVRERFRAVVRDLEERALVDERPGRTADEAAVEAGALLPDLAGDLRAGAATFDDVQYGGRAATAAQAERLAVLDRAVTAARPRLDRVVVAP